MRYMLITFLVYIFITSAIIYPYKSFSQEKCANLKKGVFYSYSEKSDSPTVYFRNGDVQKELHPDTKQFNLWKIKWISDCVYTLNFLSGNTSESIENASAKKNTAFIKILELTENYYTYESHLNALNGKVVWSDTIWIKRKLQQLAGDLPIIAYTDKNDKVKLYKNGTWEYTKEDIPAPNSENPDASLSLNKNKFLKDKNETLLVRSKKLNVGVYINPNKWGYLKANINEDAEFNFNMKDIDFYGVLITEKTLIPFENLENIIFTNAQNNSSDAEIIKKEYRIVNGIKVLCLQIKLTVQGIKAVSFSYNFSDKNGTVQFACFANQNLFQQNYQTIENFLNGLVML